MQETVPSCFMADQSSDSKEVLGEHWFPVADVSVESIRERSASSALPPHYFLHVWFARRPLSASRAAIAASLLPQNADHEAFLHLNGIPTNVDIVKVYKEFIRAKAEKRKTTNIFSWKRSYTYTPNMDDLAHFHTNITTALGRKPIIFDPFAGGGSIPLESIRLGLDVTTNDLNPVAFIILKGTVEYPARFGKCLLTAVDAFCKHIHAEASTKLTSYFPKSCGTEIYAYLWARTVRCPRCDFIIPLSPNWWIVRTDSEKIAARPIIDGVTKQCKFEVLKNPLLHEFDPDQGTTSGGDASCINCNSTINDEWIKAEAKEGRIGHQLYCVCTKVPKIRGNGKVWQFRPAAQDELESIRNAEAEVVAHLQDWVTEGTVPDEAFPIDANDTRPIEYGMPFWRDLFSARQLLSHVTYLNAFRDAKAALFAGLVEGTEEWEFAKAVAVYGAIVFDSCVNYDSLQCRWHSTRSLITGALDMQAFPFRSSYAEFDHSSKLWPWAQTKTLDALRDIISLLPATPGKVTSIFRPAQSTNLSAASFDAIVTDPPYAGNVMYAEMSDFFYVWLKRLIGDLFPDIFMDTLTNKIDEAISNPARFAGAKRGQMKKLAHQDYAAKMEASFRECRRILRDDGVLCVMFTHRTQGAWQDLAESLMNAGFTLRASWPIHTEPGQKFGKVNKGNLKVTVILYCRKRIAGRSILWEKLADEIRETARCKVREYKNLGITGPDLIVSVFGPALGVFSDCYPVKDVTGKVVRAGDALNIVAQVVNEYLTGDIQGADASTLAYLNLLQFNPGLVVEEDFARIITVFGANSGIDALDVRSGAGLIKKEKGKVKILTAKERISEGVLNPTQPDQLKGLMDVVHAALVLYEQKGLGAVTHLLEETGHDSMDAGFLSVLTVIGGISEDADPKLASEASIATALLEALGRTTASISRRGEKITDY